MKGAQAIARVLKAEGAECLFCFPVNHVIDAAAELDIRPIMARTERTLIGMADGFTRVSNGRRIGVCAVQMGPGVENSFGGIAQAFSDSTPILLIAGGVASSRTSVLPNFEAVPPYQHITKWAARINAVERISEFLRRAYTYLRTGRPSPVLLEAPMDLMVAELAESAFRYSPVRSPSSMASPADVADAVKALVAARRPLIQAGLGILYAEAWDELRELAELLQAPVMTTLPGKSAFPEDHALSLGSGGLAGPRAAAQFLKECDLIFGAGSSLSVTPFGAPIPRGRTTIQLTVDERDLNKDGATDLPLLGNAKLVLQQMIEETRKQLGPDGRRGDGQAAREIAQIKEAWLGEWMPKLTSDEVPLNPYRVLWDLIHTLDLRNTIATHDAGSPRDQMSPFWPALTPNSYVGWGKSTHLGYGLPLAMGAKVAQPGKTVVNVMGDAAFGMSGLDVETAARNRIGTLTVILNNGCLGGYEKWLPIATQKYGTRYLTGDYARVAEGLGAYVEKIDQPSDIVPAVRRAQEVTAGGRPAVLECITKEETQLSVYW